ncbi:MAG: LysM peptidoglycan-binding domain-containing protein [Anaerolineales bacterium]
MPKNIYFILVVALMAVFVLAGCERSASAPSSLPTATMPLEPPAGGETATEDQMALLWAYATQTAMVNTPEPLVVTETPTPTPLEIIPITPTETPVLPPTGVPGTPVVVAVTPNPAITPIVGRPTTYALQPGEFPYCIARRFNIDPQELLALNGLTDGEVYYPGLTLQIPQTGNPFPGERSLRPHPATYTVSSSQDTIYRIACYYGDVDPAQIAAVNNLTSPYTLQVGQTLSIP